MLLSVRNLWVSLNKPISWLRFGSVLKRDESVVFFPQSARRNPRGGWTVPFHAWVVELESKTLLRRLGSQAVFDLLDLAGIAEQQSNNRLFTDRLSWFLADREINKRLVLSIAGRQFKSPRTSRNGHVKFEIHYNKEIEPGNMLACSVLGSPAQVISSDWQLSSDVEVAGLLESPAGSVSAGMVELVPSTGLSVISDIDDTLKISNVADRRQLVKGIFFETYRVVPGMPELCRHLKNQGASFHYVSSSPWQLYPSLKPFLEQHYPFGSVCLRRFFVGDRSIFEFFQSSMSYKTKTITRILDDYPRRHFVLIGDSGEKDPEVYCEIARRYPDQITALLIRNIVHTEVENTARWQRLREQLGGVPLFLFDEPSAIDSMELQTATAGLSE